MLKIEFIIQKVKICSVYVMSLQVGLHRPFFFGFFTLLLFDDEVVDGRERADWADVSERIESTVAVDGVATSFVSSFCTGDAGLTSSVTVGLSSSGSPCDKRNYGCKIKYGSRSEHSWFYPVLI